MTLPIVEMNYWAILLAAMVNLGIGAAWYSPWMFGGPWLKVRGKSEPDRFQFQVGYVTTAVASLCLAFALSYAVRQLEAITVLEGMKVGLFISMGLVVTRLAPHYAFEGRHTALFFIDAGFDVAGLVMMSTILTIWQ